MKNDISHIKEDLCYIKGELSIIKIILGGILASMILTLLGLLLG